MSKQLSISATFSIFAMAAFVLSATPATDMKTGAATNSPAPKFNVQARDLPTPALFE